MQALLRAGASASRHACDEFMATVRGGWADVVEVVVENAAPSCGRCLDAGLVAAMGFWSSRMAEALLEAAVKSGTAKMVADAAAITAAFTAALKLGWEDLAKRIMGGWRGIGPNPLKAQLDAAVELVYRTHGHDAPKVHALVSLCLTEGARGPRTGDTLLAACRDGRHALVELLVKHGLSSTHHGGAAVLFAIDTQRPELLAKLLPYTTPPERESKSPPREFLAEGLARAIALAENPAQLDTVFTLVSYLLHRTNLAGSEAVEKALWTVAGYFPPPPDVQDEDKDKHSRLLHLVRELLFAGRVDVNRDKGLVVQKAVALGRIELLEIMFASTYKAKGRPWSSAGAPCIASTASLNAGLSCSLHLQPAALRLRVATCQVLQ